MACSGHPLNSSRHLQGKGMIYHSFGAGGGGELWRYGAIVMPLSQGDAGSKSQQRLQLVLAAHGRDLRQLQESLVFHVSALAKPLPKASWNLEERATITKCPPSFCLVPEVPETPATIPKCGWAPELKPSVDVKGTLANGTMTLDASLAPFHSGNHTAVMIWVTPVRSPQLVMWQTPEFSIESADIYDMDSLLNV